jgi:NADH-quinone oxidoreductase subunit J
MIATIFFYIFAVLLLASAAMVVSARNPVHSVLFMIMAFFNAGALFLIAGAEFLAMVLVFVYVGAVALFFLFVVMMLDVNFAELRGGFQRYLPVGAAVGAILFLELVGLYWGWQLSPQAPVLRLSPAPPISNTQALGNVLYTDYVFLFQVAGLVLLVAMIGAIVLTLRDRKTSRHQNVAVQHARTAAETMVMVDVAIGAGVKELGIYRPKPPEPAPQPAHEPAHESALADAGHHGHGAQHAPEVK